MRAIYKYKNMGIDRDIGEPMDKIYNVEDYDETHYSVRIGPSVCILYRWRFVVLEEL